MDGLDTLNKGETTLYLQCPLSMLKMKIPKMTKMKEGKNKNKNKKIKKFWKKAKIQEMVSLEIFVFLGHKKGHCNPSGRGDKFKNCK